MDDFNVFDSAFNQTSMHHLQSVIIALKTSPFEIPFYMNL